MRKLILAGALACLLAPAGAGAADAPKGDVFAGYSLYKRDVAGESVSFHGWQASLAKNLGHLGLVADFSGHYKEGSDDLTYMGGLRYSFYGARATVFAQGLAGGIKTSSGIKVLGVSISESQSSFAWAAGGGLSFRVSGHFDVRAQADYLAFTRDDEGQGGPRFAAGVAYVWR
jgi:opacity protein-like surface antigen